MSAQAPEGRPQVRVALHDECELVTAGLRAMLASHPPRARAVDFRFVPVASHEVDILLADLSVRPVCMPRPGPVLVAYSWHQSPAEVTRALAAGAHGFISKATTCSVLLEALEAVVAGERVVCVSSGLPASTPAGVTRNPARAVTLSRRETEVVGCITLGLSNKEIAERLFLSINSVKTYIRTAYRKLKVNNRAQAVRWGLENGLKTPARADHHRVS